MLRLLGSLLIVLQGVLIMLWIFHDQVNIPDLLFWGGRTHPILVHFPIALLCMLTLSWLFKRWIGEALFRDSTFRNLLLFSAFVATLTALSGYFLAGDTDYDENLLNRHRHLGSLTALLSSLLWFVYPGMPRQTDAALPPIPVARSILFSALNLLSFLVLVITGHYGGSLTHGEGYLSPDEDVQTPAPRVVTDSSSLFEVAVLPLFEQKCAGCHNEKKSKGGLVMTTLEGLQKGGKNGAPWIPGDPLRSLMVERMMLDLADKKHMPPKGKPQLGEAEIALISYWIQRGADLHLQLRALAADDSLRRRAENLIPAAATAAEKRYDFPPADPARLARLQNPYRHIVPVHQGSPALNLSFFLRRQFTLSMLEECKPLAQQIVSVNLAHMPVGDEVIPVLSNFPRLEQLNLSGTGITGKNLSMLSAQKHLETISLSGTRVSAESLQGLRGLPKLRTVYLAKAHIDSISLSILRSSMPRVQWITGSAVDSRERLKLTPPQPGDPDKRIFAAQELFSLRHPMKGVTIRYTADGSLPDSVRSGVYQSPIPVPRPMTVRAIAVMEGWLASEEVRYQVFTSGLQPVRSRLTSFPDTRYALQGAPSLFDGQTGEPGNLLVNWMGFREQPMNLLVALKGDGEIDSVIVSTGINLGAYVFPAQEIRVRAGMDSGRWESSTTMRPEQPKGYGPMQNMPFIVKLRPGRWKYLEITVQPVPVLPSWHGGRGQKGWAFIDEIFID
jgi:uncharacterized membrane protein